MDAYVWTRCSRVKTGCSASQECLSLQRSGSTRQRYLQPPTPSLNSCHVAVDTDVLSVMSGIAVATSRCALLDLPSDPGATQAARHTNRSAATLSSPILCPKDSIDRPIIHPRLLEGDQYAHDASVDRSGGAGHEAIKDGSITKSIEDLTKQLKPEAACFMAWEGKRSGMMVLDMKESSQFPIIAEQLFIPLEAEVEFIRA